MRLLEVKCRGAQKMHEMRQQKNDLAQIQTGNSHKEK
jgi:ribosomal protein L29